MSISTREYHFIKQPKLGDNVKVYLNKHRYCFGYVVGLFERKELHPSYINSDGKTIEEFYTVTDCVMLTEVNTVRFNKIDYFLDVERVDFKID